MGWGTLQVPPILKSNLPYLGLVCVVRSVDGLVKDKEKDKEGKKKDKKKGFF